MMNDRGLAQRIVIQPGVRFGKPCVAGTRIAVEDVLELVETGTGVDVIVERFYPDLKVDDIRACLWYARELVSSEEVHLKTG